MPDDMMGGSLEETGVAPAPAEGDVGVTPEPVGSGGISELSGLSGQMQTGFKGVIEQIAPDRAEGARIIADMGADPDEEMKFTISIPAKEQGKLVAPGASVRRMTREAAAGLSDEYPKEFLEAMGLA
jgi:hypothetical protein